ncbi:MAG TPA: family 20 glycosylhydrolase [Streptosporangiales bacterium]
MFRRHRPSGPAARIRRLPCLALLVAASVLATLVSYAGATKAPAAAATEPWPTGADVRDVARTGTATASTVYSPQPDRFAAAHVNDGDLSTRWASDSPEDGYPDPSHEWVQVELAQPSPVHHVVIYWETAHAAHYQIQVSDDGRNWQTALDVPEAPGGRELLNVGWTTPVKFVRMQGLAVATVWGYSIWQFEIWNGPRPGAGLPAGTVIPTPVSQTKVDAAPFELTSHTHIVTSSARARPVADQLRRALRPATGFPLPVAADPPRQGDVELVLADSEAPGDTPLAVSEGYTIAVDPDRIRIGAATRHGLFNGIQTLRQLLPPWIYGDQPRPGPWQVDATRISDYPRFAHRGLMIDPARNFIHVDEVESIIDDLAAVKGNVLHMHLTDDQGWRLAVDTWPKLAKVGGSMSMPGGRTGYYTRDDFTAIVHYAAQRHIQVIPEIELPAHSGAARAAYPELGCGGDYLCAGQDLTFRFIDDVVAELAEISPSKYVHVGADESAMPHDDYVRFVRHVERILADHGKTMIGWSPSPGVGLDPSSVHQYWQDQSREMTSSWFQPRRPVILSPTQQVYLDYPYPGYNTRRSYSWDPFDITDGWTGANLQRDFGLDNDDILGLEAPIWGERMLRGLPDIQYNVFPRLAAIMEKAWSPAEATDDADVMLARMQNQGARWMFEGTNFYADPEVAWKPAAVGTEPTADATGTVDGDVATVAVPGAAPSTLHATIDWGDGTVTDGTVTGRPPGDRQLNGLFQVGGQHHYAPGRYAGTVHVTGPGQLDLTARFSVDADS